MRESLIFGLLISVMLLATPIVSVSAEPSSGLLFGDITQLSFDYYIEEGNNFGGSPRFTLFFWMTDHWAAIYIYLGTPVFGALPTGSWQSTGNFIGDTEPRFQIGWLGWYMTDHAGALALAGGLQVEYIYLDLDGGWGQDQVMLVDNIRVNDFILTAPPLPPQCHLYGKATFVEDGQPDTWAIRLTSIAEVYQYHGYTYPYSFSGVYFVPPLPVEVEIDIKPYSFPNSINLKSKGVVPVAVFDINDLDPTTVKLAGASPVHWAIEDVDGDGDMDMIFHFKTQELSIVGAEAMLTGTTLGGVPVYGIDTVNIVK